MEKQSYIVKGFACNEEVRLYALEGTQLVREAKRRHQTVRTSTAAFGRTLLGTSLIANMFLKNADDILTVRIDGDGPIGGIVVTSDVDGNVRGYVQDPKADVPHKYKGKLDVGAVVGKGTLFVTKEYGLKSNFTGQVPLASGEIAEDFTYYLAASEQIPSSVALGVLLDEQGEVTEAGGFVIQLMPNASEETICILEERLKDLKPISTYLSEGHTAEELLAHIAGEGELKILEKHDVSYRCTCSKERYNRALQTLPDHDLEELMEDQETEIICEFCKDAYYFTREEIKELKDTKEYSTHQALNIEK